MKGWKRVDLKNQARKRRVLPGGFVDKFTVECGHLYL